MVHAFPAQSVDQLARNPIVQNESTYSRISVQSFPQFGELGIVFFLCSFDSYFKFFLIFVKGMQYGSSVFDFSRSFKLLYVYQRLSSAFCILLRSTHCHTRFCRKNVLISFWRILALLYVYKPGSGPGPQRVQTVLFQSL